MKEITVKDIKVGFRFDEHGSWFKEIVEIIKKSAEKILVKVVEDDGFIQYITFNVRKGIICDGKSMAYSHTTCREDALYFF